jgi:hypothetical protein
MGVRRRRQSPRSFTPSPTLAPRGGGRKDRASTHSRDRGIGQTPLSPPAKPGAYLAEPQLGPRMMGSFMGAAPDSDGARRGSGMPGLRRTVGRGTRRGPVGVVFRLRVDVEPAKAAGAAPAAPDLVGPGELGTRGVDKRSVGPGLARVEVVLVRPLRQGSLGALHLQGHLTDDALQLCEIRPCQIGVATAQRVIAGVAPPRSDAVEGPLRRREVDHLAACADAPHRRSARG